MSVYEDLPDPDVIRRVNVHFYDLVYGDPWLGQYFDLADKEFLTGQQTDFITGAIGGPKVYSGRTPAHAHPHMVITDELFDHRGALLRQSLAAAKAPDVLREAWLRIDEAHRRAIVNPDPSQCRQRWRNDKILDFPKPESRRAAS